MRVIEVARFGDPSVLVLTSAPDPRPGPGQVRIAVAASDTLWLETMVRAGRGGQFFPVEPPYRPGVGAAGTVTAVGSGVDPQWTGRRVVARTGHAGGGYATVALAAEAALVAIPEGVPDRTAAAVLHDGVTALALLDVAPIAAGDRVLITAAAGGMGAILVQLATAAGATVIAAARGAAKLARLRDLGAAAVVDYSEPGWTAGLDPVDTVLDGAGGDYGRAALTLVRPGGRFSGHGMPAGGFTAGTRPDVTATGIQAVQLPPERHRAYLARALSMALRPLIGQVYPLSEAPAAHRGMEERTAVGKTILVP
ncbi:zinc-binding dehydrogenase [Dactylosporangium vinaceum]|uniref:Zinc-binding dehydrogenase n=1 Tax=Dactylosporangium vinaceum TaxID=53362 RepID=A0ABV5MHD3_9ACTN|nr:zinc-binding dehydrogenase [Dactylosporangium vinaceum]UAB94801.1 zinc-binding dehydrogenase [Dactylosporangium vinaceum]